MLSCEKEYSYELSAEELSRFLLDNQLQLSRYYSNEPIDYVDSDSVEKAETDLWPYVSEWLPDDLYVFETEGRLTVVQNQVKAPFNDSAMINRSYMISVNNEKILLKFVNHRYEELTYRVVSFGDKRLTLATTWNGNVVYSEYHSIQ